MIIDIHAHTSNRPLKNLHVTSATIDDLQGLALDFRIRKIVLLATYFPFKGTGVYNNDLLDRISGLDRFGLDLFLPFGSLDAMNNLSAGLAELRQLTDQKLLTGLKLYPGYQRFDIASPNMDPFYEMAMAHNLPVAIHSGELHHCCPKNQQGVRSCIVDRGCCPIDELGYLAHPGNIARAVKRFPYVNFILCHLSNPFFGELRQLMSECDNVYTDISGQFLSASDESTDDYKALVVDEIKRFLDLDDGIKRVMFGTDFPIQSYQDSIELVEALGLSEAEKQFIYYKNAIKLLELKEE